jgi:transglutaminase-like putative cysteine protease
MKYRVTHQTEYFYSERVPLCHNLIRLRPRDTVFQKCIRHAMGIKPTPADRRERVDFFGNHVTWIAIQEPHESLNIHVVSEVEVKPHSIPPGEEGPPWEQVPEMLRTQLDPAIVRTYEYTFDSPFVPRDPALAAYARPSFRPGAPLLSCIHDLTQRIWHEFTFDTGATTIGTPVLDVLRHRHGVCQDFAHLEIGCLRSLGLAARYVSGYVVTRPPPGKPRLIGADASHAWISAFIPQLGWIDFDPTNGVIPSSEHITLGWARDYDDVSPVEGIITGGHRHTLSFAVDVETISTPTNGDGAAEKAPSEGREMIQKDTK